MARLNEAGHIVVGTPDGQTGCCHIEVFGKEKEGKAGRKRRKEGRPEEKFCCRWVTLGDMRHHDSALSPFNQKEARKGE